MNFRVCRRADPALVNELLTKPRHQASRIICERYAENRRALERA
jgi:hypothetical protein